MAQIDEVQSRIIDYFSHVAEIAKNNPPPAINAGNGWLRENMVAPRMADFGTALSTPLTEADASKMFNIYKTFFEACEKSFEKRENFPNSFLDQVEIILEVAFNDIVALVEDILKLTSLTATQISTITQDYQKILSDVKGVERNGRHLNGWIALDLKGAADNAIAQLIGFTDPKATKMAELLKAALQKLSGLSKGKKPDDDGNTPWLRSEWQVSYLAITSSIAIGLQNL